MEIRRALAIFKINKKVSPDSLNTIFRELVKKYHPDKVRDYPEWAHEKMSEINEAYETIKIWLSRPPEKKENTSNKSFKNNPVNNPVKNKDREKNNFHSIKDIAPLTLNSRKRFYPVFNKFLDALGLYYQYGLEIPENRKEGVRRFRYREALKLIYNSKKEMEQLLSQLNHPVISSALRFIRLTLADIETGYLRMPPDKEYTKIDNDFRNARKIFNNAVKEIFFPELVPPNLRGRSTALMYSCYTQFILYLTSLSAERKDAGVLMTARFDALSELIEMRNYQLIDF